MISIKTIEHPIPLERTIEIISIITENKNQNEVPSL
jgi:hypothetical protein